MKQRTTGRKGGTERRKARQEPSRVSPHCSGWNQPLIYSTRFSSTGCTKGQLRSQQAANLRSGSTSKEASRICLPSDKNGICTAKLFSGFLPPNSSHSLLGREDGIPQPRLARARLGAFLGRSEELEAGRTKIPAKEGRKEGRSPQAWHPEGGRSGGQSVSQSASQLASLPPPCQLLPHPRAAHFTKQARAGPTAEAASGDQGTVPCREPRGGGQ